VDPRGLQGTPDDTVVTSPDLRPDGRPWGAGCGDVTTDKYVPDSFFGVVSFTDACNKHDSCYETPGADKLACDDALAENMKAACGEKLKSIAIILYPLCSLQGSFYGFAVRNFGGSAFDSAQKMAKEKEEIFWKNIERRMNTPESEWEPI
jgi:hypothetical protein